MPFLLFSTKERMTIVTFITKREWGSVGKDWYSQRYENKKTSGCCNKWKRAVAFAKKNKEYAILWEARDN